MVLVLNHPVRPSRRFFCAFLGAQGTSSKHAICSSSGLLATNLPLLPRRLQLPVALGVDLMQPPRQHVLRRDVARGAVQSDVVVVVHVTLNQTTRVIEDNGVPGRMHSPLSDLCQRSISPFDCGRTARFGRASCLRSE